MRIIQITDLHLPGPGDVDEKQVDRAWGAWSEMQKTVDELGADLIVNTGDICRNEPQSEIYSRYFKGLESMSTPMIHLGGNHDALDMLDPFGSQKTEQKHAGFELLFLHCKSDRVLSEHQLLLMDRLKKGNIPLVIFMHYPPLYAGCPYMDRGHAFSDIETLLPALSRANRPSYIFCGHYHMARTLNSGALRVHITPSPYMNIDPAYRERVDSDLYRRPYREITLHEGKMEERLLEA